jgi:hypothetical protein
VDLRVKLVSEMDRWQLCQLAMSVILPLRPDEAAGLLIADVNLTNGWLEFGERFKDANFTKGKVAFVLPFPGELRPILRTCLAGRAEGPLLRSRKAFGGQQDLQPARFIENLAALFDRELLEQPPGTVQAEQDRKTLFRALLRKLGGVTEDAMNREFKNCSPPQGCRTGPPCTPCAAR